MEEMYEQKLTRMIFLTGQESVRSSLQRKPSRPQAKLE